MNRKLFSGLLLLMVATGGVGTFTSCKDTEQDFRNDVLVGQQDLSDQIAAIRNLTDQTFLTKLDNEINRLIDARDYATAAELAELASQLEAANDRIDVLTEALEKVDAANAANAEEIAKLNERLETVINDLKQAVDDCKAYTDSKVNELKEEVKNSLDELGKRLDGVEATANEANELAQLNAEKIEKLDERLTAIEERVGVLEDEVAELKDKVDDLYTLCADLLDHINTLAGTVAEIQEDVDELNKKVANLFTNLERLVTGLIVEQTYNPVFGTLNLPVGVQSNMLINYYYMGAEDVTFPVGNNIHEYTTNEEVFGNASTKLPIASPETYTANTEKLESLGNLYMTINPIQRSFDGLDFELVKSNGEAIPGKFVAEASDDVLSFGYTRADSPNGFYKAKIVTDSDAELIKAIKVDVEDGLKDAFKNAVQNHTKQDFVELAKLLYKQFDGVLPAYAAKVSWDALDADGKEVKKSVLSGYDLAVTTFRPLSYSTGFGVGSDKQLPTFGSLQSVVNQLFDDIKASFTLDLNLDDVHFDPIEISIDEIKIDDVDDLVITIPEQPIFQGDEKIGVLPKTTLTITYIDGELEQYDPANPNSGQLNKLVDAIVDAINAVVTGDFIDDINDKINTEIVAQVNDMVNKINEQLKSVNTQIYDAIDDIQKKVNAQLNGTLGQTAQNLIDLYNRFAEKINNIIKNPNAYLQVVMGYEGVDGDVHHLSTVKNDPTYVSPGVIQLFMTSYNAEIIVPSYKKYVAITKVDDAVATAELNAKVNGEEHGLNQVLSGNQQSLAFDASKLEAGKTYEIFYQSLDFHGYTSTRKYYIRVK